MRLREIVRKGLALTGVVMVLVPVLMMADSQLQVAWVVAGVLLIEVGVWDLAALLLPDERRYDDLREEVDAFLDDVRHLNDRAVEGDDAGVEDVRRRLDARLDRIVEAAGRSADP